MSRLKTTTALTAALLVTGLGLAVAQTEDQNQPADPMTAATAATPSEQTPADPNAQPMQQVDPATQQMQQQTQSQTPPPVDTTTPLPSDNAARSATGSSYPSAQSTTAPMTDSKRTDGSNASYGSGTEPAPRADRN